MCDNGAAIAAVATPASSTCYTAAYTWDARNRPTGITYGDVPAATPAPLAAVTFGHGYNAVNQRISQTVSDNGWIAYPSGPTTTTGYTANSLNQYTCVGVTSPSCTGVVPTYDGNGNLTYDGTYTLGYDAENRLTSASASGLTAAYAYDARGRRKAKTVNGTTTVFVTDADNREVLEYDGSTGTILRWYAYGLGANDVLAQTTPGVTPARVTFIPDLQGSIIGSMTTAGALTSFAYRPYGGSASPPAQFAYTGQRIDPETTYYYYRMRNYSSAWGRFLQPDPIGYTASANLYAYVQNDPLNAVDPSGLTTFQLGLSAGGGLGIFAVSFSVGIAVDLHGNATFYWNGGGGVGAGGYVKGGATGAVTTAETIYQLQSEWNPPTFSGLTRATSVNFGLGLGGSFEKGNYNQDNVSYTSWGGTVGLASGFGVSRQLQYTQLFGPNVQWTDPAGRDLTSVQLQYLGGDQFLPSQPANIQLTSFDADLSQQATSPSSPPSQMSPPPK